MRPKSVWTDAQREILRQKWPTNSAAHVALLVGKSQNICYAECKRLGIRRNLAYKKKILTKNGKQVGAFGRKLSLKANERVVQTLSGRGFEVVNDDNSTRRHVLRG